jgi:hypothetical protein
MLGLGVEWSGMDLYPMCLVVVEVEFGARQSLLLRFIAEIVRRGPGKDQCTMLSSETVEPCGLGSSTLLVGYLVFLGYDSYTMCRRVLL